MHQSLPPDSSGNGFIALLFFAALAAWCWSGRGPLCLRWPAVAALLLTLPGTGSLLSSFAGALVGPVLLFAILLFALNMMIRGRVGGRQRRHYHEVRRHERWSRH